MKNAIKILLQYFAGWWDRGQEKLTNLCLFGLGQKILNNLQLINIFYILKRVIIYLKNLSIFKIFFKNYKRLKKAFMAIHIAFAAIYLAYNYNSLDWDACLMIWQEVCLHLKAVVISWPVMAWLFSIVTGTWSFIYGASKAIAEDASTWEGKTSPAKTLNDGGSNWSKNNFVSSQSELKEIRLNAHPAQPNCTQARPGAGDGVSYTNHPDTYDNHQNTSTEPRSDGWLNWISQNKYYIAGGIFLICAGYISYEYWEEIKPISTNWSWITITLCP